MDSVERAVGLSKTTLKEAYKASLWYKRTKTKGATQSLVLSLCYTMSIHAGDIA